MSSSIIESNLKEAQQILDLFIQDKNNIALIDNAANTIASAFKKGNKVISCGNGGSMCDAMHFAEELSGRFRNNRPPLPAISISDPSHLSCVANDYGYDYVFSRYIEALGNSGDVLLAISTSGNSTNIVNAVEVANKKGIQVIGLTGKNGGKMAQLCNIEIRAPYSEFADRAQEIHIKVIHSLIHCIETILF